ncbi:Ribonuclease 3 [Alteracholeplasma palmae J233]|uniref:Ribonuclease 3 n=1 Tax=Alteracholeplasma palmae (strain ATCC 49389 / J233) TaxID=1318466 RepID=U4KLG0_ALTPJ|nr:ribonuclease III [Alteracholeplasma palmae]CCV64774.1 Ribonuclease 3 [Alteracholeplasma palmae J233]
MKKLFDLLEITPKNINIYERALTHSSYANENQVEDNERLEFLGDAVIDLFMAEYLYHSDKNDEGVMTKKRAQAVCEEALVVYAEKINLKNYILLGKGEKAKGLKNSILADAFEALFSAIYLDLGYFVAKSVFNKIVIPYLDLVVNIKDYKTKLQELVQADKRTINYQIVLEKGPAHNKEFVAEVYLEDILLGSGSGKTKKEAEQMAAKKALSIVARGE